jgi:hypothetical protein
MMFLVTDIDRLVFYADISRGHSLFISFDSYLSQSSEEVL